MRPAAILALISSLACSAQDWDLYVRGVITDELTGEPIHDAGVEVWDQYDADYDGEVHPGVRGDYEVQLYTGGNYVIEFTAPGHVTRQAVVDASNVGREVTGAIAWRITMNVKLKPAKAATEQDPGSQLLGQCVYSRESKDLRWTTAEARKSFPIERYDEQRIAAHEAIVDSVYATEGGMIDGEVKDHWTGAPIGGAHVHVAAADGYTLDLDTDELGYYAFTLPYDRIYTLTYSKPGLVSKAVELDMNHVPEEEQKRSFRTVVDIRLFAEIPGEDFSFLNEPVGRAKWDPTAGNMAWDMEYIRPRLEKIEAILERHPPGR